MNRRENFLKACKFSEPEWVPTDCSSHAGMMYQEFEKLAKYFGIDKPLYQSNYIGMVDYFDERVWKNFPIDVRTIWMRASSYFKKDYKFEDPKVYQVPDFGFIMKESPIYDEFWDFPLKDATAENVKDSNWWPDANDSARIEGLKEQVKKLYEETDFVIKAGIPVNGLMEVSQRMRGLDRFFIDLASDPKFVNNYLDKQLEIQKEFYSVYLNEVGEYVQVIEYADDFGMQTGLQISLNMYREYFKPRHKAIFDHIHSLTDAKIYLHSCGAISELIPDWTEIGVDIIESLQPKAKGMEAEKLKKDFGGKIIFWGGLDVQEILPNGTPQEVKAEVKRIIEKFAPGGGYIFSPAHAVQPDVPIENFIAMWEAVEEYGKYPIKKSNS